MIGKLVPRGPCVDPGTLAYHGGPYHLQELATASGLLCPAPKSSENAPATGSIFQSKNEPEIGPGGKGQAAG